jgi:hypothetical protein
MKKFIIVALTLSPVVAAAQNNTPTTFAGLVSLFIDIIKLTLPVLVGIAILIFFKGLIVFIGKSGDAKTHEDGRNLMIWGIIALFVMVSVFGLLRLFYSDFGFGSAKPFGLPLLPT